MPGGPHIADFLSSELAPEEKEHLLGCPQCRDERALVEPALALMPPLPAVEPRTGFAAMVARNARDRRAPPFAQWLRWAFGGLALAGAAAVAVMVAVPQGASRSHEVMVAQRLELLEDMTVMQNQQALEDLDVVAVLHQLEAQP